MLIATPDGTQAAWRGIARAAGWALGLLARCVPFLRRATRVELKEAAGAGVSAERRRGRTATGTRPAVNTGRRAA